MERSLSCVCLPSKWNLGFSFSPSPLSRLLSPPLLEQTTGHLSAKVDFLLKLSTGAVACNMLWLFIQSKWRIWSYIITSKLDVWSDALTWMPGSVISFVPEWRSFWRRWWLVPSVSWRWYLAGCLDIFSAQSWSLSQLLQFFHTSPLILKQIYM